MAKKPITGRPVTRINLEVSVADKKELYDKAKVLSESPTLVGAIRTALKLFVVIMEAQKAGSSIFIRQKNGNEEKVIIL